MNKNYRYNRSTKNFQGGGEWKTGKPKNPKLSAKLAGAAATVIGGIGTALNIPSKEQRLENVQRKKSNAIEGTARYNRLKKREEKLSQARRGGTKRRRK